METLINEFSLGLLAFQTLKLVWVVSLILALYKLYKTKNVDSKLMWFLFIIWMPFIGAAVFLIKLNKEQKSLETS